MGNIMVKNIGGMGWKARISMIAMFTLVLSGLIYHGWRHSQDALAAVTVGTAWSNIHAAAPDTNMESNTDYSTTSSGTFTAGTGNNRLLLVAVYYELDSSSSGTFSATFGGTTVTQIATTAGSSGREHMWLGYVKSANIPSSASTVRATYRTSSSNRLRSISIKVGMYTNVDQNSPVVGSNARLTSSTSVSTNGTVSYANGGMTVLAHANGGTSVTPSVSASPTLSVVSSATNTSNHATYIYTSSPHTSTSSYASGGISVSYSGSPSSRSALVAASLRPATTTLGNGVVGTTANVAPGATGQKIDGFSFTTNSTGTADSVTALTVTTTNQAAIAGMQIWNETGTTQYFGTVNNPGSNTWNFSGGAAIPVTNTATNFKILVTYKTRAAGAPEGNTTTTAHVSAFTCSNLTAGTDTADTTLTLLNTHKPSTWGTNTPGNAQITLNWTYGTPGQSVIIVRYTANSDTTKPVDGTTYTVGSGFGSGGTVRYNGTASTFTDSVGLTNGVAYYYKIFEYDTFRFYYNATDVWTAGLTPLSPDSVPPAVDPGFAATTPVNSVNVPITSFSATDNAGGSGIAGYLITTGATQPSAGAADWSVTPPATFTVAGAGTHTLYPWAKDGGGNVSGAYASPVTVVVDTTAPTVSTFTVTSPVTSLTIPITSFTGTDSGGSGLAGYMITTSSTPPAAEDPGWTSTAPATFTVGANGIYTLSPWVKDTAGNVSAAFAFPRTILVDTAPPSGLTLVSPADEATGVPVTVTLQCSTATDISGPVMHWFDISNDSGYAQNSSWISGTSFSPTGLQQGINYVWKVKAKDSLGNETAFTTPRSFTTTAPCVRNNPTLTLLTPTGSIASTISTDGGTSAYNLKVINNDFGDCGSTTFNLSLEDVDLYNVFDPSILGTSSVTLIPGAQQTTTVTVKATPGHDSGVSKTRATAAADAYHAAMTTAYVQTTLNVVSCTPKTPLLIVGPSSGYLNKGGTMVYTITVKNTAAGAGCSPVDFNLYVVSDSNNTDFYGSQLSMTTLQLNSGEIGSATLTVSAKPTATRDAFNHTVIRVAAAGHTSPADVSVRSIVNNPMLHNSDNTGSAKWAASGGWGVPNGRYGEFTCETCHVGGGGDTSNVKRIEERIYTPYTSTGQRFPGHGQPVAYRRYVGTSPDQPLLGWDGSPATPRISSSRICEICHTYDATGANGSKAHPYSTTATLGSHFNTDGKDCTRCHKHSRGFGAAGMVCNSCHGDSSTGTITADNRYVIAPPANAAGANGTVSGTGLVSTDPKVGAHQTHLRYLNGYSNYSTVDYRCQGCHGTLPADFAHADGSTILSFQGVAGKWGAVTPAYDIATRKCSNVYCHGGGMTGSGATDYSPTWNVGIMTGNTGATGDCSKCHQYLPPPQSGESGSAHAGITLATQCRECHTHTNAAGTGFDNAALHVNGIVEGGTCISCHGSAKSGDRRQVTGTGGDIDNGMTSHHIKYTADLNNADCGVCHDQSNHKTYTDGVIVYLKNLDSGASVIFDGTAANNGKTACLSCHDANGASSLGANAMRPFAASGDTTAPANVAWPATGGAHDGKMACFNCHGKSGAANTTLDPIYNGHGSPSAKLLHDANYAAATPNTYCYNCHDAASTDTNKSAKNIKGQFALANKHTTADCFDCHGDGTAAGNTANLHKLKAGNHTNATTIAGNLASATGKGATWSAASAWPSTSNATFSTVNPATAEWQVCFKCHAGTGFATGGTGSLSMTDLALEFNPNNQSYHPVIQPLPATGNRRLAATALTGGWTPGMVMTCTDCHATNQSSSYGPHGSSVKWMLNPKTTGTKYYNWPFQTAANNGSSTATNYLTGTGTTTSPTANFCFSCHTWAGGGGAHTQRSSGHAAKCVECHIRVPHGGKALRLLTGYSGTTLPARYFPNGAGGGTPLMNGGSRPASGTMGESNCNASGGICGGSRHRASGTALTW